MLAIDVVLIVIITFLTLIGIKQGFIKTLGSLVGLVVGVILSGIILGYLQVQYEILAQPVVSIIAFIGISIVVSWLIGWLFSIIEGMKKVLSIIPFVNSANHLLGGILGLLEGVFLVLAIGFVLTNFFPEGDLQNAALNSAVLDQVDIGYGLIGLILPG
jgi:membrane protein required for colicin V production